MNYISANTAILTGLIATAVDLHEPGEGGGEYTRGQANLIADFCDIPGDVAFDVLMPMLFNAHGRTAAEMADIVLKAAEAYRA
jgi:hypothetical protein